MKDPLNIEELFKEKLEHFEATPRANAWSSIQSGVASKVAATASGASAWVGTAIVSTALVVATVAGYFYFNSEGEKRVEKAIEQRSTKEEESTVKEETQTELNSKEILNDPESAAIKEENNEQLNNSTEVVQTNSPKVVASKNSQESTISNSIIDEEINEISNTELIVDSDADATLNENIEPESQGKNEMVEADMPATMPLEKNSDKDDATAVQSENETTINGENTKNNAFDEAEKFVAESDFFPNVFTPGFDGTNDLFKLDPRKTESIDEIEVKIYSVTNKFVGQWHGKYNGWDGSLPDGSLAPKGLYSFMAIITIDGKKYPKRGSFQLR